MYVKVHDYQDFVMQDGIWKLSQLLRVLMVKQPDIWKPTFGGQFMLGCNIKSTHLSDVPKAKSWDLGACTGLQVADHGLVLIWANLGLFLKCFLDTKWQV